MRVASGRVEARDFYAVLGAEPSATAAELRAAFRAAVLRHHPDRSTADSLATRRTSVLNRAWSELRDPLRRLHYDHAMERGSAATLPWPLSPGDAASLPPRRARGVRTARSRWHTPHWRHVHGFRIPAEVFAQGPAAQHAWIVANQIEREDWREHTERYWLRYAAAYYRERGRTDDWLGAQERLLELDTSFDSLERAGLRDVYSSTGQYLRGADFLRGAAAQYAPDSAPHRWIARELRALLGEYRDARVRRGSPQDRAEAAELLLNFLEALDMQPGFADVRAAIIAHRRAGNQARAMELIERAATVPVHEPARWFSLVQLLTEAGELDRASALLAEIARGDRPGALDRRRIGGDPVRRIAAARVRLQRARERATGRATRVAAAAGRA